jgi:hypothetical protein
MLFAMMAASLASAQSVQRPLLPAPATGAGSGGAGSPPAATLIDPNPDVPRPPAPIGNPALAPPPPAPPLAVPAARTPPPAETGRAANPSGLVPPVMGGVAVSARFGKEAPAILAGLHWRIYADTPDGAGQMKMLREDKSASPAFVLPPGGYIVHVALGLANAARRVQIRTEMVREIFDLPAGGLRFDGRVADSPIPQGQVAFDVFIGSQFDPGEKRPIVSDVTPGTVVLLPEGTYHVVSNYGDGNAVMRYDVRVQAGKLTDARINHRAAVITLKLVSEAGGEALANTAWSVLTPGGDVIKESIGAFPVVVLAEGDYVALARNEGKVYNREFKVETGFDREIELLAR